jgi:flagellar motility protein MotE (MotC chaperone)
VKAFKVFLTKYDLLNDKEGQVRTLYSLRHTYATTRLRQGISWDDLAIQMGTSRAMLERHYSKFKVEDRAAEFSGLEEKRRKQLAKEKSELEKAKKTIDTLEKTIRTLNQTIKALLNKVKTKKRKVLAAKKSADSKPSVQKH